MDEIKDWLKGKSRDYEAGVALYAKFGKFQSVLALLRKQKLPQKLAEALRETLNEHKEHVAAVKVDASIDLGIQSIKPQPEAKPFVAKREAALSSQDETLKARSEQPEFAANEKAWKTLYGEFAAYKIKLNGCSTNESRLAMALQLADIHERIVEHWHKRDYFLAHGDWPTEPLRKKKVKGAITGNEFQRLASVRSNLSIKKSELRKLERALLEFPSDKALQDKAAKKRGQIEALEAEKQKLENGTK
jgi:hypothetical protein